jgi:4-hydroxybenzoate polyprenyltransferase
MVMPLGPSGDSPDEEKGDRPSGTVAKSDASKPGREVKANAPSDPPSGSPQDVESPSRIQSLELPILPEFKRGSLLWRIRGMIKTLRPNQWVKNLFVVAPIVFAKHLTDPVLIRSAISAFAAFCLLSGAVYTLNDIVDVEQDRVHKVKRYRPIPSGRVPLPLAKAMAATLVGVALGGAALVTWSFFGVALGYFTLNLAYSFKLKKVAYVDVGCIALGFVLRVLAGGFATGTPISIYMIACTAFLALFLGFGKRRHELASATASKSRSALEAYTPRALNIALTLTGLASVGNYLAYTLDHETQRFFATSWLWVTTVHTLFGVVRFLQLVGGRPKAESPTQEMLRDVPFVLNLVLWVLEVIAFVYHVRLS